MDAERTSGLELLGREIAKEQDRQRASRVALRGEAEVAGFLASLEKPEEVRSWGKPLVFVSAAVAVCAVALLIMVPGDLSFTVEGASASVGEMVRAEDASVPINFSDGTEIWLEPKSLALVRSVDEHGAVVSVESGRAYVRVVHREKARWQVYAGPYRVRVTGTSFQVSWSPESETLDVRMDDGRVIVDGPYLEKPRELRGGERLVLAPRRDEAVESGSEVQPHKDDGELEDDTGEENNHEAPTALDSHAGKPPVRRVGKVKTPPSWSSLAEERKYNDAFVAAESQGFERLCEVLDAKSLIKLADVARFSGNAGEAEHALLRLRTRFPGTQKAATAAYLLGRLSFRKKASAKQVERWFNLYLAEAPSGPLAGEALGRVMELQHRQGRQAAARATAERYLTENPGGSHSELAKKLVGR